MERLTPDELFAVTGKKTARAQLRVLREKRIPHHDDGDGKPVVIKELYFKMIMGEDAPKTQTTEPDWSHVA